MATRSPLFDIYDPYGILQQQAEFGMLPEAGEDLDPLGIAPLGPRKPQLSDLMPAEEQSGMLNSLAAMGSSGLAGLGWILDTPGSVVRGALSGGPMKGLSALWETSDDRITGRELLRQYGLAGDTDNWANFAGGLIAEMALDPLTYGTLGLNQVLGAPAKTLAGRAAEKAGLLKDFDLYARNSMKMGRRQAMREATPRSLMARQVLEGATPDVARETSERFSHLMGGLQGNALEEALDTPIARMNRVGLPGREGAYDLFGQTIGDATAKWADQFGDNLMRNDYTGPLLRRATAMVGDPNVLGRTGYEQQWDARALSASRRNTESVLRRQLADLQMRAGNSLRQRGMDLSSPEVTAAIRTRLERPDLLTPEMDAILGVPEVDGLASFFEVYRDQAKASADALGVPLAEMNSRAGTGFAPRQASEFDVPQMPAWPAGVTPPESVRRQYSRGNRLLNFTDNYGRQRKEALDVMGGTGTLNQMARDGELQRRLREATPDEAAQILDNWALDNESFKDNGLFEWVQYRDEGPKSKLDELVTRRDTLLERAGGPTSRTKKLDAEIAKLQPLTENPRYLYDAPELPASHPLMQQTANLRKEIERRTRAGEIDAIPSMNRRSVDELKAELASVAEAIPDAQRDEWRKKLYAGLAEWVTQLDPQYAAKGVDYFGQNWMNEMARYVLGRGRVETDAKFAMDLLKKYADNPLDEIAGGVNYSAADALKQLGLTGQNAEQVLEGVLGRSLDEVSFPKAAIDDWAKVVDPGRMPEELSPLANKLNDYNKTFKTLALAWPSRDTRDLYSGAFGAAMLNSFNPFDWYAGTQLRKGNYDPLIKPMLGGLIPPRLAGVPGFDQLLKENPEEAVRKFLLDASSQRLGNSTATDEVLDGVANAQMRELYPGAAPPTWGDLGRRFYNPDRTYREALRDYNPFAVRGGNGNRNPLLELSDRAAETTDAANRYGTYINQIRRGVSPEEAARITNLTQVNYAPDAFTGFERDILRRWVFPFYSYSRGILPLVGDEIVNRPAGLMGKSIRAITRGSEPSEDNFTPEYLRQSAAIPLPAGGLFGLDPESSLKRYLTNIDLPFESVVNLVTPGVSNSTLGALGGTVSKTALNLLGQTNPLIKGPLEQITNRQFYSGRQLSDLYSMFEQTLGSPGRLIEQVAMNAPGGSRAIGLTRQMLDDRLDASEKLSKLAVNTLTGLKFQDVDQERTKRLAARDMLNQLLESTPGVRTYENITVPEDVLRTMPENQRRQYLLYKIIQAEAAKRARDKKKAESALDPLEVLGVAGRL